MTSSRFETDVSLKTDCCFCQDEVIVNEAWETMYGLSHSKCFLDWQMRGRNAVRKFKPADQKNMYFTRPGHVFVQTQDWHWFQKPLTKITPVDDVILCVIPGCNKHATQLDAFWPYYAEWTRCPEHAKLPTPPGVIDNLEERNQG